MDYSKSGRKAIIGEHEIIWRILNGSALLALHASGIIVRAGRCACSLLLY